MRRAECKSAAPRVCVLLTQSGLRRTQAHSERHAYWRGNEPARQGGLVGWQGLLEARMTGHGSGAGGKSSKICLCGELGPPCNVFKNLSKICLCE